MTNAIIGTTFAFTDRASSMLPFPGGVMLTPIAIARFLGSMAAASELATAASTVNRVLATARSVAGRALISQAEAEAWAPAVALAAAKPSTTAADSRLVERDLRYSFTIPVTTWGQRPNQSTVTPAARSAHAILIDDARPDRRNSPFLSLCICATRGRNGA